MTPTGSSRTTASATKAALDESAVQAERRVRGGEDAVAEQVAAQHLERAQVRTVDVRRRRRVPAVGPAHAREPLAQRIEGHGPLDDSPVADDAPHSGVEHESAGLRGSEHSSELGVVLVGEVLGGVDGLVDDRSGRRVELANGLRASTLTAATRARRRTSRRPPRS